MTPQVTEEMISAAVRVATKLRVGNHAGTYTKAEWRIILIAALDAGQFTTSPSGPPNGRYLSLG